MRSPVRGLVVVLTILIGSATGACGGGDPKPQPVSEADARKVLDAAVARGLVRDDDALCKMSAAVKLCEGILRDAADRRPTEPPRVVNVRTIEPKGDSVGGTVLELEGVDGTGKTYRGDFFVYDSGDGPTPQQPVWWSGIKTDESATD